MDSEERSPGGSAVGLLRALCAGLTALALAPGTLHAQQPEVTGKPADQQSLITDLPLALILNGEPRGDVFAKLAADGELLLSVEDFARMDVTVVGGMRYNFGGVDYVLVSSIPNARSTFDETNLSLALNLPPESFAAQLRQLTSRRSAQVVETHDDSAFLNYRVLAAGVEDARSNSLANEFGVRREQWLFLSASQYVDDDAGSQFHRFQTRLIRDEREQARRWVVGDAFTPARDLGSTLNLGGVGVSKSYLLTPYAVHSPTANFTGSVATPADVEVYIGGTRVFRDQLAPGPYDLRDFSYYGGRRDVRIVVRDALGREQVVEYPYYFTDRVLAPGLQEYNYHAGALRRDYGQDGDRYSGLALAASHRIGVNDHWTLGGTGEYGEGRMNAGPEAALRSDTLGVLMAAVSYGRDPDAGSGGLGWSAGWQYQYESVNVRLEGRGLARDYGLADPVQNAAHLTREYVAGAGYGTTRLGYANLQWLTRAGLAEPEHEAVQLNYSRTLYRRLSLFASVQRDSAQPGTAFSAGLMSWFGDDNNASAFHAHNGDTDSQTAQLSNIFRDRQGLGYRVDAENVSQPQAGYARVTPYVEANLPTATYSAQVSQQTPTGTTAGDATTSWQAAMQGSIYKLPGHWGLGRDIDDGFALVQLEPPVENVRIYQSGREVGRTNREGAVLLPAIASFLDNSIGIDDKDVPIHYTIQEVERTISPPYRAGSFVAFRFGVSRNVAGQLVLRTPTGARPLDYTAFVLHTGAGDIASQTGEGGEFYLENLAAGELHGRVELGDKSCSFVLVLPEQVAPVIELAEPVICE